MNGSLPEVSINERLYRRPQVSATIRPVSIPPVNATMCVSGMLDQLLACAAASANDLYQPGRKRIECGDELQRGQRR